MTVTYTITHDDGTETEETSYVHFAACSARLLSLGMCTCDSGAEGPVAEALNEAQRIRGEWATVIGASEDVGKRWNRDLHGDPRTVTPPSEASRLMGAVCSTMRTCSAPNVLVEMSFDAEFIRYNGLCQTCGASFYAVEARP